MSYIRDYQVAEIFGNADAPPELRITDASTLKILNEGPVDSAKPIVRGMIARVASQYQRSLNAARQAQQQARWKDLPDEQRREAELKSRVSLTHGMASLRMAEWELPGVTAKDALVFGELFTKRLDEAAEQLSEADALHPNHYLVLQLLGLVYSEPRRDPSGRSVAEQYFERAIQANPADYVGHEQLASLLFRRAVDSGVDVSGREIFERGLAQAETAVRLREVSGTAHLLRGQFQTLLLEIERDEARQKELRAGLDRSIDQAARFLPHVFRREDVDLMWLRLVTATRRLGTSGGAASFDSGKSSALQLADDLLAQCRLLESRWVNSQRVFHVGKVKESAVRLKDQIAAATSGNWRDIRIAFP